jgi:prolyl-tRNA synthetase
MSHSDDTGLVLPPKVAPIQVAIVPIVNNKSPERHAEIVERSKALVALLKANGVRAVVDEDITTSPGARFFKWERKVREYTDA